MTVCICNQNVCSCLPNLTFPVLDSEQVDRYFYLIDLMLSARQPVLLVGPSGVGKTSLVQVSRVDCYFKLFHIRVRSHELA